MKTFWASIQFNLKEIIVFFTTVMNAAHVQLADLESEEKKDIDRYII